MQQTKETEGVYVRSCTDELNKFTAPQEVDE